MSAHNPHAGQGPVVVDIGGVVGALVLYTGPEMVGAEIEISPVGDSSSRQHVQVIRRSVGSSGPDDSTSVYAAVYYGLTAGTYQLWQADGRPTDTVTVEGGRITEVRWSRIVGQPKGSIQEQIDSSRHRTTLSTTKG